MISNSENTDITPPTTTTNNNTTTRSKCQKVAGKSSNTFNYNPSLAIVLFTSTHSLAPFI